MESKEQNKEIQSRRDFFKKAAKSALPILGAVLLANAPTIVKAAESSPMGCDNSCRSGCYRTCDGCEGSCRGTCKYDACENSCRSICKGTCKYDSCESSCHGTCKRTCKYSAS